MPPIGAKAFRWPENKHDIALATEVTACSPVKPKDWEALAARLSRMFSAESTEVELKGRGCRERLDRLIDKFKAEDAKALKRSGTEEEYDELSHLLESIITFRRDFAELKSKEKELKKKKEEDDRKKAEEMKKAAMEGMAKKRGNDTSLSSNEEDSDEEDLNTPKKETRRKRFSKHSALQMLANKNETKAELRVKELALKQRELDFKKMKFEAESEERKEKFKLEMEERKTMLELLKKHL